MKRPAELGGPRAFDPPLAVARPPTPPLDAVVVRLRPSYESGILTNGPLVRLLEQRAAARLAVDHAVAVSSCTSGLMLVLRALDVRGPVVLPSFTFAASAHSVAWNGLPLAFAECDPATFQLDSADVANRLSGAGAVMATHVFGAPCAAEAFEEIADRAGIPLVFDAAHGFGATHAARPVGGFGDAEVFSLSPTKLVVAGEGGIVTTDDTDLAEAIRLGRDYGNPGDYDTLFAGLNARMSELHAALALESLDGLDEHLAHRRALAARYEQGLAALSGVRVQLVPDGDDSTWKDFTVAVDARDFGMSRAGILRALATEGIETRCYFSPPVHRQRAYEGNGTDLPVTDGVSAGVMSLPLHVGMTPDDVDLVVESLEAIQAHAPELSEEPRR